MVNRKPTSVIMVHVRKQGVINSKPACVILMHVRVMANKEPALLFMVHVRQQSVVTGEHIKPSFVIMLGHPRRHFNLFTKTIINTPLEINSGCHIMVM